MTESSEESDVDHNELEEVQSSRSLAQSSNTDSESEEENHPVHGFVIESILHEKEEKGDTLYYVKLAGNPFTTCQW